MARLRFCTEIPGCLHIGQVVGLQTTGTLNATRARIVGGRLAKRQFVLRNTSHFRSSRATRFTQQPPVFVSFPTRPVAMVAPALSISPSQKHLDDVICCVCGVIYRPLIHFGDNSHGASFAQADHALQPMSGKQGNGTEALKNHHSSHTEDWFRLGQGRVPRCNENPHQRNWRMALGFLASAGNTEHPIRISPHLRDIHQTPAFLVSIRLGVLDADRTISPLRR